MKNMQGTMVQRIQGGLALCALAGGGLFWLWPPAADGQPAGPALPASLAGPAAGRILWQPSTEPQPLPKPHFMDDPASRHVKALYPQLPPLETGAAVNIATQPLSDPFEGPRSLKINATLPEAAGWVPPMAPPVRVGP